MNVFVFFSIFGGCLGGEVCWEGLGCLSTSYPWVSLLRPFPPPKSPSYINPRITVCTRNKREGTKVTVWPKTGLSKTDYRPGRAVTVLLVHGFATTGKASWMHQIKDLYLDQLDANVLIVDWRKGAVKQNYPQVASNARVVGALLAKLVGELTAEGQDVSKMHVIGHSLGAHIAGYVAKTVGKPFGRVTALDPAQPGFEGVHKKVRLGVEDASLVDVIHTDAKPFIPFLGLGMMRPIGHVDIYVNGGSSQPGCLSKSVPMINSLLDIVYLPVEALRRYFACSHMRSYEVFISALKTSNCTMWARKMPFVETFLKITTLGALSLADPLIGDVSQCTEDTCTALGLFTPRYSARGTFTVKTNPHPPYCETLEEVERERQGGLVGGVSWLVGQAVNLTSTRVAAVGSTVNRAFSYLTGRQPSSGTSSPAGQASHSTSNPTSVS